MTSRIRPAWRWLVYVAAASVITLAMLVGVLRLLLPMVQQYQDDIRAWASAATGYDIRFQRISASWPLAGPELSFYEVSLVRPGESEPLLSARELSAGVSLLRLLRDGRPSLSHVAVRGSSLRVERSAAGDWRFQGRRLEDLLPAPSGERQPELKFDLDDIAVSFFDYGREPAPVALTVARLTASLAREALVVKAHVRLPRDFGQELDIDLAVPLPLPAPLSMPATWNMRVSGTSLDVARILEFGRGDRGPLGAASGDLALEVRFRDAQADILAADVNLRDVAIAGSDGPATYQRVAGGLRWARGDAGWQAVLSDLRIRREGRDSPAGNAELRYEASGEVTAERWIGRATFLRLEDLFPVARAVFAGTEFEPRLPRELRGDIRDLEADFSADAEEPSRYALRFGFERLGLTTAAGEIAVAGLTGRATADGDGGRLELSSQAVSLELAQWFRDRLDAQALNGLLVWRAGPGGVRLLSDDIVLQAAAIDIRSRLEMRFPADDSSPVIDIKATASATEARQMLRYLPLRRFPPKVVEWLERAVVAGRVPRAAVDFRGPLRDFPYERGEGVFRVALDLEDATLDYANGWPRIEDLDAEVVFDGVGMYSTTNRARLGTLAVNDYTIRIRDLREGVLALSGRQRVGLDKVFGFVRATPIARTLGPTLERVTADGPVDTALRLALPIKELDDYRLDVLFDARGCRLGLQRLPLDLKDLRGRIRLQNTRFSGDGLTAVMLGEPVTLALRPGAPDADVSHVAELKGATPVARVMSTFGLPLREYFDGRLNWTASVQIPAPRERDGVPLSVVIRSDLTGVASSMPQPLTKASETVWPAELDLSFPGSDVIDVTGRLQPPFAWALRLVSTAGGWRVDRGELHAGPGEARLPQRRGVEITGRVEALRLSDWLALGTGGGGREMRETYRDANIEFDQIAVAGQLFRDVSASARRGPDGWMVSVRSPNAEGEIAVPFDTETKPLRMDMKRLWLLEPEAGGEGELSDPREMIAIELTAEDGALGRRRLGRVELSAVRAPDGLVARRIATRSASFQIDGDGAWRVEGVDPRRQDTRLALTLQGKDIRDALERLGYDPAMSGDKVRVTANLTWPGGPGADFLKTASGRIGVELERGQVLNVEPGGGRILGLLSVTALPRRLALDFRDVFKEGLAFDSIRGDFRVESGNAYTCNLGLSGPGADIGIIGRTGLGSQDYDQLAVVRPQVSSVLAVGGAVLGGPVGGVTMLLISQIFRKPLSTLGESYYRVSGGWDQPDVVRVQRSEVDAAAFKDCERELAAALAAAEEISPADVTINAAPQEPR